MPSPFAELLAAGPAPIDGGFATELEARGEDLSDRLWSARLVRDDPALVEDVHRAYLEAGARVVITASYQASRAGYAAAGASAAQADRLIGASVGLARAAGDAQRAAHPDVPAALVAASLGPYGVVRADGSEYTGDYGGADRATIAAFHADRVAVLRAAAPDLLAWETIPSIVEADAIAELQTAFDGPDAWVSFQCRDGGRIADGTPIEEAVRRVAAAPGVRAVGCNCTAPEHVLELIGRVRAAAPDRGVVVYPNDGRVWDGQARTWATGGDGCFPDETVRAWRDAGADLIGGCCGVGPAGVRAIAAALASRAPRH